MQTKKIIGIALAASLVASMAATAAMSASAAGISSVDEIKDHSVGLVGSFNGWGGNGPDVVMTDDDGDGVFEGVIDVESVTSDMISEATMDDGTGEQVSRGITGIIFKVRLDSDWSDSWGDYEAPYVRTWNSQTNCAVAAEEGDHIQIAVQLDTTKNCDEAIEAGEVDADEAVDFTLIPVTYTVTLVERGDTVETDDEPVETVDEPTDEPTVDPEIESDDEPVIDPIYVDPVDTDDEPVDTWDEPTVVPTDDDVVPTNDPTVNPDDTTTDASTDPAAETSDDNGTDATNTADKEKVVVETKNEASKGSNSDNGSANGSTSGTTDAPSTGDGAMAAAFIAVAAAASGAGFLAFRKKRV